MVMIGKILVGFMSLSGNTWGPSAPGRRDNGAMDTTHTPGPTPEDDEIDALLGRLEDGDPADAPDVAEEVAAKLAATVDLERADGGDDNGG